MPPERWASQRPTIIDVAALSGVSKSTVSNVLRDAGRVSEATRGRVREAIGLDRVAADDRHVAQARLRELLDQGLDLEIAQRRDDDIGLGGDEFGHQGRELARVIIE